MVRTKLKYVVRTHLYELYAYLLQYNVGNSLANTWIFIGYKFLSRADFGLISDHFFEIYPFQNKNDHFKKKHATSCFHF